MTASLEIKTGLDAPPVGQQLSRQGLTVGNQIYWQRMYDAG